VRLGSPPQKGAINNTIKFNFVAEIYMCSMYLSGLKSSFFGTIEKSILLMSK
jgi:hypothetical protein